MKTHNASIPFVRGHSSLKSITAGWQMEFMTGIQEREETQEKCWGEVLCKQEGAQLRGLGANAELRQTSAYILSSFLQERRTQGQRQ